MIDQYFGTKELHQVAVKTINKIKIGTRILLPGEPILYFKNVKLSILNQSSEPIMARGGWGNPPLVIWEDRGPIYFNLSEGIMTRTGMSILFGAEMIHKSGRVRIPRTEILELDNYGQAQLRFAPIIDDENFCYTYEFNTIQKRIDFSLNGNIIDCGTDYALSQILVEYYFQYDQEAMIYLIKKEIFNSGNFRLEGKFYMKSENDQIRRSNLIIMPRIEITSNINFTLGEHADPVVSTFKITAMPRSAGIGNETIMEIIALDEDIDADI